MLTAVVVCRMAALHQRQVRQCMGHIKLNRVCARHKASRPDRMLNEGKGSLPLFSLPQSKMLY
jgi:hypothetical protein